MHHDTTQIKEHMPVVCSNGNQFATVDKVEGNSIKLTKDKSGQHHWIPLSWVDHVDQHVHIDRPGQQAMQEWSSSPIQDGSMPATGTRSMGGDMESASGRAGGNNMPLGDQGIKGGYGAAESGREA